MCFGCHSALLRSRHGVSSVRKETRHIQPHKFVYVCRTHLVVVIILEPLNVVWINIKYIIL